MQGTRREGVKPQSIHDLKSITQTQLQVLGHTKTVCVLLGGALLFHDPITLKVGIGMSLAVAGMVGYGYFTNKEKEATPAAAAGKGESKSLLPKVPSGSVSSTGDSALRLLSCVL